MHSQEILERAREGDPKVIAAILNHVLKPLGVHTQAARREQTLHLVLEAEALPDPRRLSSAIKKLIQELQIKSLEQIVLYGQRSGEDSVAWKQDLVLMSEPTVSSMTNPQTNMPETLPEASTSPPTSVTVPVENLEPAPETMELTEDVPAVAMTSPSPEADIFVAPETDVLADSEANIFVAPETDIFVAPETDVFADPEADIFVVSETDIFVVPEAEGVADPETEAVVDSDVDIFADLESEAVVDSESETVADSDADVFVVSESEAVVDSDADIFADSEAEVVVAPEAEGVVSPEANIFVVPEAEVLVVPESEIVAPASEVVAPETEVVVVSEAIVAPPVETAIAPVAPPVTSVAIASPETGIPPMDSLDDDESIKAIVKALERPESVILIFALVLTTLWELYLDLAEGNSEEALTGSSLAQRLQVSPSTVSRRKDLEDFSAWSQSLDPEGIAWIYRAGRFWPLESSIIAN